jgi:hypothetical protein
MPTCKRCGFETVEQRIACPECGQPFPPPGMGLARLSLVLGFLSYPLLCAFGLGFIAALFAVVFGIFALARAARTPALREGNKSAIGGIALGSVCIGGAVLLALPGMLASRVSHNEAAAIVDTRAVIMAEFEYSKANGDYYDSLACVAAPAHCIPGYDATKPGFLATDLASATTKSGYARSFLPGPAPPDGKRPKTASPTSITAYAYVAMPVSPGSSGRRSFCGDNGGRVCVMNDGSRPALDKDGLCAPSCPDLR